MDTTDLSMLWGPSPPLNLPSSFGNGVSVLCINAGGFIWVTCKEEARSSECLLDHPLPQLWLVLHRSGRMGRLQLTTVFPLWLSFISSQLTNAYWLFSVHVHCCTRWKKIFTTKPWLNFSCFPDVHVRELSYIMWKRSGQADTHCFWTRSLWVYRLWQAPVSQVALKVSVHYLLSIRNEWDNMSSKFGFPLLLLENKHQVFITSDLLTKPACWVT